VRGRLKISFDRAARFGILERVKLSAEPGKLSGLSCFWGRTLAEAPRGE
jgi:hypothetical protein